MRSAFADRIARQMTRCGLIQSELARRADVDRRLLSRVIRGQQQVIRDQDVVERLARALGTTVRWLVGSVDDPDPVVRPTVHRRPLPGYPQVQPRAQRPPLTKSEIADLEAEAQLADRERLDLLDAEPEAFFMRKLRRPFLRETVGRVRHGAGGHRGAVPLYGDGGDAIISLGAATDTIERPPILFGRPGAYALIAGPGLEPRYRQGEVLYIVPDLGLRSDDWIVAVTRAIHGDAGIVPGAPLARVRILSRIMRRGAELIIPGSNGSEIMPLENLVAVHRIVLAGERTLCPGR